MKTNLSTGWMWHAGVTLLLAYLVIATTPGDPSPVIAVLGVGLATIGLVAPVFRDAADIIEDHRSEERDDR